MLDGVRVAPARVRPSYLPFLRAHTELVERGVPPTCNNLAKELGVSRQSVWQFLTRHPDVSEWIDLHMDKAARRMTGSVIRRVGNLAIQGSDRHADIYFRFMAGAYARAGAMGDPASPPPGVVAGVQFTINNLIPRPPALEAEPAVPIPALPPAMTVPTVEVR